MGKTAQATRVEYKIVKKANINMIRILQKRFPAYELLRLNLSKISLEDLANFMWTA